MGDKGNTKGVIIPKAEIELKHLAMHGEMVHCPTNNVSTAFICNTHLHSQMGLQSINTPKNHVFWPI